MQQEVSALIDENKKLYDRVQELEKAKIWLDNQNNKLLNENRILQDWTQEQDRAKKWLIEKIAQIEKESTLLWFYLSQRSPRPDKTRFHHITSLGYNCEVSFRIEGHYGKCDSTIYSWCYVKNREDFLRSLENPKRLAADDMYLLPNGMFQCVNYDITFHTKIPHSELFNENEQVQMKAQEMAKSEMKERYSYLSEKFNRMLKNGEEDSLFALKMCPWEKDVAKNKDFINELLKKFRELAVGDNFRILVVLEKKMENLELLPLENRQVYIRFIDQYAADSETDTGGDISGWNAILSEFEFIRVIN